MSKKKELVFFICVTLMFTGLIFALPNGEVTLQAPQQDTISIVTHIKKNGAVAPIQPWTFYFRYGLPYSHISESTAVSNTVSTTNGTVTVSFTPSLNVGSYSYGLWVSANQTVTKIYSGRMNITSWAIENTPTVSLKARIDGSVYDVYIVGGGAKIK